MYGIQVISVSKHYIWYQVKKQVLNPVTYNRYTVTDVKKTPDFIKNVGY